MDPNRQTGRTHSGERGRMQHWMEENKRLKYTRNDE